MRYFEKKKARIEIIPMVDVMFFLLVFFIMVTLRMIPATGVSSQLPTSNTAQTLSHPKIVVTLLADGNIMVEQTQLTPDQLTAKLAAMPNHARAAVTIVGAKNVSLQALLRVMDACRKAGVTEVGIAAKRTE